MLAANHHYNYIVLVGPKVNENSSAMMRVLLPPIRRAGKETSISTLTKTNTERLWCVCIHVSHRRPRGNEMHDCPIFTNTSRAVLIV